MIKKHISREMIIKSICKMADNQKLVRLFLKGKIDLKTLDDRGVKLKKPF